MTLLETIIAKRVFLNPRSPLLNIYLVHSNKLCDSEHSTNLYWSWPQNCLNPVVAFTVVSHTVPRQHVQHWCKVLMFPKPNISAPQM